MTKKISIDEKNFITRVFHKERITVYPTTVHIDEIKYWPDNDRTIFSFDKLKHERGVDSLEEIGLDEITKFLASQPIHKLSELSKSILDNGVQVPLILDDEGMLLDGNRRFFACQLLKITEPSLPQVLTEIQVHVIKRKDIDDNDLELKILAEVNFVPNLRIPWPLDAQARAVSKYFKEHISSADPIKEVANVFGITKARATDFIETLEITDDFISRAGDIDEQVVRREIVEGKFVYFWEFRNKAYKGRSKYTDPMQKQEVTDFFYKLVSMGKESPIKNVKQIESLAQSRRDKTAWQMLLESNGKSLPEVVELMKSKKERRKSEDKIRLFHSWLKDTENFEEGAKKRLKNLADYINSLDLGDD